MLTTILTTVAVFILVGAIFALAVVIGVIFIGRYVVRKTAEHEDV